MCTDIKRLTTATQQLTNAVAAVYTAPTGKAAQIGTIIFHNTNTTAEAVELYDNGSGASNRILNISIAANETFEFAPKVPLCLAGGENLQAKSTTTLKTNIKIYGREEI